MNSAGVEASFLFTNYNYNPVIDKYFAKDRFYDARTGRMLGRDPIKIRVVGDAIVGGSFRLMDYITQQTEAGKKVNPLEAVKAMMSGMGRGAMSGLAAGSNPVSALSQMGGIVGNIITRVMHAKAYGEAIDIGQIAREVLYDRYGGRPDTKPSAAPARSQRDPRTGCGANGSGNGYGYNYGTSGSLRTTPSLFGNLKERWADPNTMVSDLSTAVSLTAFGVSSVYKAGNAVKTFMNNRNTLANVTRVSQERVQMNLQFFGGGKSGSATMKPPGVVNGRTPSTRLADKVQQLPNSQRPNTVATVRTIDGKYYIGKNKGGVLNDTIDQTLNQLGNVNQFNRQCAEVNALSRALNKGANLEGATISIANVRGINNASGIHGTYKPPCNVCDPLLEIFKITDIH